ncbi:hypothetical protein E2C01_077719 [Portunus trituberculatus]|uniref:Uncharacterized protein n=1 Tax=Portunus trituberculatus TaxID=210409 RepID=A0A5B7IF60_PORTR|nr:hypothetical protein [Portunus trituberculatus]
MLNLLVKSISNGKKQQQHSISNTSLRLYTLHWRLKAWTSEAATWDMGGEFQLAMLIKVKTPNTSHGDNITLTNSCRCPFRYPYLNFTT